MGSPPRDFKSLASTNFATQASEPRFYNLRSGLSGPGRPRTLTMRTIIGGVTGEFVPGLCRSPHSSHSERSGAF